MKTDRKVSREVAKTLTLSWAITVLWVIPSLRLIPQLPQEIGIHFNSAGRPDDFGSPLGFIITLAVISVVISPIVSIGMYGDFGFGGMRRILSGITAATAAFIGSLAFYTIYLHRGVSNATDVHLDGTVQLVGISAALVAFIIGWLICSPMPDEPNIQLMGAGAKMTAKWRGSATAGIGLCIFYLGIVVGLIGVFFLAQLPYFSLLALPVAAMLFSAARVDVYIDQEGIGWNLLFGLFSRRIPWEKITDLSVTTVHAGDYDGWGWRDGGHCFVILVRSGDGLRIEYEGRRPLIITVDGAQEAVAIASEIRQ